MIINLPKENLKGLHFLTENINYPVVIATYSEWEEQQVQYFMQSVKSTNLTSEAICRWCINHDMKYQILFITSFKTIIKHPYKYIKYLQLKRKLDVDF